MSTRVMKSIRAKFLRHAKFVNRSLFGADTGPTAPVQIFLRWENCEGLAATSTRTASGT